MKKILKQPRRKVLLFAGIGFSALLLSSPLYVPVLLSGMGEYLVTDEAPKAADAIVVLSGSISERAMEAAELYKQGLAPKIFLTKMKRSRSHRYVESTLHIDIPDEDELNFQILRKLGVKEQAIYVAAEEINSTEDEARVLKPLFKEQGIQSILLVTSKSHTKRAEKIFRWVFGSEIQITPVPSRYDTFDGSRWWRNRGYARQVAYEYQKLLFFSLRYLQESNFMSYILTFAVAFVLSLVLTPIVRKMMLQLGILDQPSESRWHRQPIALMGGIAIFISFALVAFLRVELRREILVILPGGGIIFVLGLLDDAFGTRPKVKFAIQVLVAFGIAYFGVVSKILPYNWLNIFLTVFWMVGLINALNMLDNIDGLSSGITIIAALAIFGLSLQKGETNVALLSLALAGSCLGFLRYNFNPAKIFMGDCGSMFLGYMLATLAVLGGWQRSSPFVGSFLAPILILSVAIFDTTLVTILRLRHGKMPWQGGRDHSSHRLVSILDGNEKGAVLFLYGVGILAASLALIGVKLSSLMGILIAAAFFVGLILFGIRLAKVECYRQR